MKNIQRLMILGAVTAMTLSGSAFAKEADYWDNYDPIIPDKGEFTEDYPITSRVLSSPVRVVSTLGGAAIGALCGMGKGIVHAEQVVSENTFEKIPGEHAAILAPAGIVGSVVAVPVGALYGSVRGFGQGTISGFMLPEAY
ncbi:MAG: hypothetical protein K2X66_06195 [Cyanobacteria bacterium]|nr:hypothetical protein [Cyanobacteriota bacterium]